MSEAHNPAELPEDEGSQLEEPPTENAEVEFTVTPDDPPEESTPTPPEPPTQSAWATFKMEKIGAEIGMNVPAQHSEELIRVSPLMLGMLLSIAGPIILLETTANLAMPWQAKLALALVLAIIPIVYVLLRSPRDEA